MRRVRVIPVMLLMDEGVYKTVSFKDPKYIGDPINTLRLFNDKEVDEMIIVDINASKEDRSPNTELIEDLASECFMPLCYGGGIQSMEDIREVIACGVEKVMMNASALKSFDLLKEASAKYGSSTIVAGVDVKKNLFGKYKVYNHVNSNTEGMDVVQYCKQLEENGAGELFINFVDREGTMKGYDLSFIDKISAQLGIPVIVCGGAAKMEDFYQAVSHGASAVAAGSMFVYHGKHKAVLINYPSQEELKNNLYLKL